MVYAHLRGRPISWCYHVLRPGLCSQHLREACMLPACTLVDSFSVFFHLECQSFLRRVQNCRKTFQHSRIVRTVRTKPADKERHAAAPICIKQTLLREGTPDNRRWKFVHGEQRGRQQGAFGFGKTASRDSLTMSKTWLLKQNLRNGSANRCRPSSSSEDLHRRSMSIYSISYR